MKKTIFLTLTLLLPALSPAQDLRHPWTLQECLDWALENSLTVKQGELNLAQQEIQTNTAKNSWLPTVSASANESVSFGRGLTADNTYTSANTTSTGFSIGGGMNLFDGLATPNSIALAKLNLEAATKDLERIRDDIRVAVARAYLQVLYDYEIVDVARQQIELDDAQVARLEALAATGKAAAVASVEALTGADAGKYNVTVLTANIDTVSAGDYIALSSATAGGSGKSLAAQPNGYLYNDIYFGALNGSANDYTLAASGAVIMYHHDGLLVELTPSAPFKDAMKAAVPGVLQVLV